MTNWWFCSKMANTTILQEHSAHCSHHASKFSLQMGWVGIFSGIRKLRHSTELNLNSHDWVFWSMKELRGHAFSSFVYATYSATSGRRTAVSLRSAGNGETVRLSLSFPFFRLVRFLTQREIRAEGGPTAQDMHQYHFGHRCVNTWQVSFSLEFGSRLALLFWKRSKIKLS